tara:strand:+ start:339 stop:1112 length:774 start_codon:yes stop_codon:yes gene_type:complete
MGKQNRPLHPATSMNKLKSSILNPSLSAYYSVVFPVPNFGGVSSAYDGELLTLTCTEAALPGSSIATLEQQNDFMGVTERHAYRKMYDESIDLTFLVTQDSDYSQIRFFDGWMKFITGEAGKDLSSATTVNRAQYPNDYRTKLWIVKFEKDMGGAYSPNSKLLEYEFVDAYPKSISSSPVSFEGNGLLKTTISMTYTRYFITQLKSQAEAISGRGRRSSGNPEFNNYYSRLTNSELMGDFGKVMDDGRLKFLSETFG